MPQLNSALTLLSDILQSVIVIFGAAVVLYNLKYVARDRVVRSFSLLLLAVIIVYFIELLVNEPIQRQPVDTLTPWTVRWLQLKWFGIAFVPAVQFHFSDALLVTTGSMTVRRRAITGVLYGMSFIGYGLVIASGLFVEMPSPLNDVTHVSAGPLYGLFALYFWATSLASIYNTWRAFRRSITSSTRRRMRNVFLAIMAAPLGVFPYLSIGDSTITQISTGLLLALILGNLLVGLMFSLLTANVIHIGSVSPDRVVRVKLLKFMARVPMTGSIVLLVYVLTNRATNRLGLDPVTFEAIAVVGTLMLVEWAIHAYKRPIERFLHFNNEPDVRRIQDLSERLLTSQDLKQFLESLLAAGCDALRVPTAFVASTTGGRVRLEAIVGPREHFDRVWTDEQIQELSNAQDLRSAENGILRWLNYWVRPLYSDQDEALVGILGLEATTDLYDPSPEELLVLERLTSQASSALDDRVLQQGVFAAVEGLLPGITALQERRGSATFGAASLLRGDSAEAQSKVTSNPEFKNMVRDALRHYWGGPKLTESPLLDLRIVQSAATEYEDNPIKGLRSVLKRAIDIQKPPEGEQSLMRPEWVLYNILELKFVQGLKVGDIARRLAMSESDLYRKQRVAIENVARAIADMEQEKATQS